LQPRELDRLVDLLEDGVNVRTGLDELGSEAECFWRGVRVLEPSRVRDQGDVEGLGQFRRQGKSQLGDDVTQDLTRRRGVRPDEIYVSEARVVVVVVDVDDDRGAADGLRVADPLRLGAVDGDENTAGRIDGQGTSEAAERHELVFGGQRRVAGQ